MVVYVEAVKAHHVVTALKRRRISCNSLDQDTVDAPSLNCFRNRLNKIRSTRMGFFMD